VALLWPWAEGMTMMTLLMRTWIPCSRNEPDNVWLGAHFESPNA
jgi:hypothetical protein